MKPASAHILSLKRVELSALTQDSEQSAKAEGDCRVLGAAVEERLSASLSPNTGQEGSPGGWCGNLPSSFSWQHLDALITVLGHSDLEFLLGFGEVTVSKADSSNPSHIIRVSELQNSVHWDKVSKVMNNTFFLSLCLPLET